MLNYLQRMSMNGDKVNEKKISPPAAEPSKVHVDFFFFFKYSQGKGKKRHSGQEEIMHRGFS